MRAFTAAALGAIGALLLLAPPGARATVLAQLPVEDMAVQADAIVVAEVVDEGVRVELNGDGPAKPWTITQLRVERWIKGNGDQTIRIHELGGRWQGGGMRIDGTPQYERGERVVVFLRRDSQGRFRTYSMVQGRFRIRASVGGPTLVQRDLDEVGLAQWTNGRMQVRAGTSTSKSQMTLKTLLGRIDTALEAVR